MSEVQPRTFPASPTTGLHPKISTRKKLTPLTLSADSLLYFVVGEQVQKCLIEFDGPLYVQASTWDGIITIWVEYCKGNHSHVVETSPPSSPDFSAASAAPEADGSPLSSLVVNISDVESTPPSSPRLRKAGKLPRAPRPAVPTSHSRLPPLPPRLRAERAAARIEAAADKAEAAAQRITEDAAKTLAMVRRAEAAARRISEHAEMAFGLMQRAGEVARLIGQEADLIVELVAANGPPAHRTAHAEAGAVRLESLLRADGFAEWVAQQRQDAGVDRT
ncbi:hypothetical protein B0H17DRAFT_1209745 [Mycena rosella]|uniref:Uncharacterized protein n=1 Tax=Mycena rosella TaxID=1033263 RepID=A0AAD7CXL8_MYCRO|nr:hypothetical protein B0H17DRAFT_1209745 [Mycena rosella]